MGFILGGFSFCSSLVDKVQKEFYIGFNINTFGKDASLAIVMGAAMFDHFNIKRNIPQYIGCEVIWKYSLCIDS
jgi:hypothetical protein